MKSKDEETLYFFCLTFNCINGLILMGLE